MPSDAPVPAKRLLIAITGATGAIYGIRLLQMLRAQQSVETHLMVSDAGVLNLHQELGMSRKDAEALADVSHSVRDVGASIASGSFQSLGMVIAPCSMKTLASVAHGLSDNLIARSADVALKERRRLVLMVRETPFNLAHLRNMTAVTEMGGIIFPPLPGFYHKPRSIEEMVDHTLARVLDLFELPHDLAPRWEGMKPLA
jgi:4-hydroxy-3-polyprenylbenzoate decarboxylase